MFLLFYTGNAIRFFFERGEEKERMIFVLGRSFRENEERVGTETPSLDGKALNRANPEMGSFAR